MAVWVNPRTWAVGEKITATRLNAHLRDQFNVLGDAWAAYTPVWTATTTNPVIGNGTIIGRKREVGKSTDFAIEILMGTTTTYGSGTYLFSLPGTAKTAPSSYYPMGLGFVRDESAGLSKNRIAGYSDTTKIFLADQDGAPVTNLVPFIFGVTDRILITGSCENA